VTAVLERVRGFSERGRRWLLPVAFVAFVATAVAAFSSLPDGLEVEPWLLALSAVAVCPLSTVANGAEFVATARAVGRHVPPGEALRVAVLSSAANLLPLPGAVAVRTHQLRGTAGTKRALGVTAGAGICWLGTAVLVAGAADAVANRRAVAVAVMTVGGATVAVAYVLVRRSSGTTATERRAWWWIWACEVGQVVVGAARLGLAVAALGHPVDLAQSLGLAVAPVAGSAVGILPGGLGVREAFAAVIGGLVDLPRSVSGAAAVVDRLLGLVVVALLVPLARKGNAVGVANAGDRADQVHQVDTRDGCDEAESSTSRGVAGRGGGGERRRGDPR
jgi:hypothetical protein